MAEKPPIIIPIGGTVYLDPFTEIVGFSLGGKKLTIPGGAFLNVFDLAIAAGLPVDTGLKLTVIVTGDVIVLDWGTGWDSGATFKLVNKARISGPGGRGAGVAPAQDGMDAMNLQGLDISIDNSEGEIFGGGGGGGTGGEFDQSAGGGGAPNGRAGGGGASDGTNDEPGAGADDGSGNIGGTGGAFGESGQFGSPPGTMGPGGPGKAINLNGGSVTWIAGNNAVQVKGAVS